MMKEVYQEALEKIKAKKALRETKDFPKRGNRIFIDGVSYYNFCSNDYLGLSSCKSLLQKFKNNLRFEEHFMGATASRYVIGGTKEAEQGERIFSEWFGKPFMLMNSGYHANVGIIPALALKETEFFADKKVHASIMDGLILSQRKFSRFKHNDIEDLERLLKKSDSKNKIVITESVFSMEGNIAPLKEFTKLKEQYHFLLYVDESHGFGVFGERLLGVCEHLDILNKVDVIVGTFGKAYGGQGAFFVAEKDLHDYLKNTVRSAIFSTLIPPVSVSWILFLQEHFEFLKERAKLLAEKINLFNQLLKRDHPSQIFPFVVGNNEQTLRISDKLFENGFYIPAIRPPSVPENQSRLRVTISAMNEDKHIKSLAKHLNEIFH